MKLRWAKAAGLSLGLLTSSAAVAGPAVTLGRPVADDDPAPAAAPDRRVIRAQCDDGFRAIIPPQAALGPPAADWPRQTISRQGVVTAAAEEPYNSGVAPGGPPPPPPSPPPYAAPPPGIPPGNPIPPPGGPFPPPPPPAPPPGGLFPQAAPGAPLAGPGGKGGLFESDHCFDEFISPVTNPFLFADPRASTEFRPIYIGQVTPRSNYLYDGGSINSLNFTGSVAFNDRWSLTINKFGWIWNDPHNGDGTLGKHVGFEEFWLGPKYTFLRSESTGTVAAGGLIFQIPTGPSKVVQDTGVLTLTPYLTLGQHFLKNFNFLSTLGYSLATDDKRSDYFYNSFHLDYDVGGYHKIYPLVELNWFHYTTSGSSRNLGFEGGDLINFGSTGVAGNDNVTMAIGARYKFNDRFQTGLAFEFPMIASKDLVNFRVTLDLIYRY